MDQPNWPRLVRPFLCCWWIMHFAMGFWFKGKGAVLGLSFGAVAAMLPLVWALAFHRELVVTYRAKRATAGQALPPLR